MISATQYRRADCDLVLDAIIRSDAPPERGIKVSRPYHRSGVVLAVRADSRASSLVGLGPDQRVGVPVGSLVARGEVALGFQQLSELMHLEGITILGAMPAAVQITTTFSGALCTKSTQGDAVRELLAFMASPEAEEARRRNGMEAAA